ncbi:Uncharacterized protein TCAP_03149 [Tolypocladium capitatum]|uniref:NAD dependent epimerase/dehydratase n=1 Tax=Tolypocladium capitatum TaxID=45235 RepID=A0A2K3QHD6_9HYPO|nr:Uncharacterized protein TCAP_03149 [Tolypocladium capitatum]
MGAVPSVPTDRSQSLQVIGAGYPRTGTVSMTIALEKLLGGPVMHSGTHLFGGKDSYAKLWCEIMRNRNNKPVLMKLLREATAGFVGITDAPGIMFLPELLELYPDAKVVLITRDPDRWFESMAPVMKNAGINLWVLRTLLFPCPTWRWAPVFLPLFGEKEMERIGVKNGKEMMTRHNDHVRSVVPPPKLLTMELKEGWAPLAEFLDKPVPKEPFPRANDSVAVAAYAKRIFITASLVWVTILSGTGIVAWSARHLWRRQVAG